MAMGRRERLDPADMVCDSKQEEFAAFIAWPPEDQTGGARPWQVQLEVRDMGGNVAVAEGAVR